MNHLQKFSSGLSGLQLPIPKFKFPAEYQDASRLTYYSTFFNSIEINSFFYKIPMKTTVAKWSASVPEDFKFTFKLFREITHVKNLDYDMAHINAFMETIAFAGKKRGCLLVQFPPSLKSEKIHQLDNLLHDIRSACQDYQQQVAVEFRNKDWYNEDVYELLEHYKASLVIHDIPVSATPFVNHTSETLYLRFHGPTGNYKGSYTDSFLNEYAEYIKQWLEEGKTVYAYFNNTAGDAFNNMVTLKSFLK